MNTSSSYQEQGWLARLASGDEAALKEILYAYSDHLGAFVYKVTGSREAAQEIVQDVFMKIWTRKSDLSDIKALSHYLFILTRNLTYNYIRNEARASVRYQRWLQEMENMSEASNFTSEEDQLARYMPLIDTAIDRLPAQQKRVFELARKQGYTQKQIAEEMGISTETVKKYMKLALQAVREYVRDQTPPSLLLILFLLYGL